MKTHALKLEKGPTTARSVLDCGSPLPLSIRRTVGPQPPENPNGILAQSPALRGTSYPGKEGDDDQQPQWGCGSPDHNNANDDTTPLGLAPFLPSPQGSSCLATLGWRTPSLWDWGCTRSRTRVLSVVLLGVLLLAAVSARAQSFSIDWFTIDGGGGTSTGGVYSLNGTIGQPDANAQPLTGDNFSLIGGFWSLLAVQTPGAPLLTIRLSTTNTAIVSWPSPSPGFTLQQNADLNTANWAAAPQTVTDNGTDKFIVVNPPTGNRFYRLFKP